MSIHIDSIKVYQRLEEDETELLHIKDSIHYKALVSDDFTEYDAYAEKHKDLQNRNYKAGHFRIMAHDRAVEPFIYILKNRDQDFWHVADGFHRLAILAWKGYEEIPLKYLRPVLSNEEIGNILQGATKHKLNNHWSNSRTDNGYHSFNLFGLDLVGQRNPAQRLEHIRKFVSLKGKKILDLGCNVGGMCFHALEANAVHGVDLDLHSIDVARTLCEKFSLSRPKFSFEVANLQNYNILGDYDVIFFLAIGAWIGAGSRDRLFVNAINHANVVIVETNGPNEIEAYDIMAKASGKIMTLIKSESLDDVTKNYTRSMYLIS